MTLREIITTQRYAEFTLRFTEKKNTPDTSKIYTNRYVLLCAFVTLREIIITQRYAGFTLRFAEKKTLQTLHCLY